MARDKQLERALKQLRRRRLRFNAPTVILLIVVLAAVWAKWREPPKPAPPDVLLPGTYRVERVVDGDTLELENSARVRLLGVDTPETVKPNHPVEPWGPEASAFTRSLIQGQDIRLEFDKERVDRYGRYLAYVWYRDEASGEEKLLNEELIRAGLGRAATEFRYSDNMKRRFRRAEEEAQAAGAGIWTARQRAA